jgi:hypothetical protein
MAPIEAVMGPVEPSLKVDVAALSMAQPPAQTVVLHITFDQNIFSFRTRRGL